MCVIALAKPGQIIPGNVIRAMYRSNRDGAGFAYVDKDTKKVVIVKGIFDEEKLVTSYQQHVLDGGHAETGPVLMHTRIATLGRVDAPNTHPFPVEGGAAAHNGSLWWGYGNSRQAEKSDTREYFERLGKYFVYEDVEAVKETLSRQLGTGNKIAAIYDGGKYTILNEQQGTWKDDVWYSNTYWNHHLRDFSTRPARGNVASGADV